jgi:hypothetical protein
MLDTLKKFFADCADAIRSQTGKTEKIKPEDMAFQINSIYAKPPAPAGEYYHAFADDGTITGLTFYGTMPASRLESDANITEVICLEDITTIPNRFAYNATAIDKVEIKGHIDTLGEFAFYGSTISKFTTPDGKENTIPERCTIIPYGCFNGCKNLSNVTLHDDITEIQSSAFERSSVGLSISNTALPANLTAIQNNAFYNQQLPITEIPAGVTTIGTKAFYQNLALKTLTFKGTPTSISSNIFSECDNLTTINVPWAKGAISNAPWGASNATINYNYTE